jgi:sulfonate transport system substrate-binding protein
MNLHPRRRGARRVLATIALAAALVPALAACGGDAKGDDPAADSRTLRVGQLGSSKVTEALLQAAGEDKDLDYKIEWSLFPTGGGGFMEAVPSGSVDVAQMADTPPIFGQVAGVEAKVVGVQTSVKQGESTVQIFAPKDSGITSMADLKGKKVGLTAGTILQYTVVKALADAGLSYDDITPVNLAPADALTAYQGGDVDAVAVLGPQLAQLTVAGDTVVGDGVGTTTGYQYAVATSKALADDAKVADITDYLQRVGRAQAWAADHQEEWTQKYAEVLGVPVEIAQVLVGRESYQWLPIDDQVIAAQQDQADAYTELGLIDSKLDVSEEFDDRLNDQLAGK